MPISFSLLQTCWFTEASDPLLHLVILITAEETDNLLL